MTLYKCSKGALLTVNTRSTTGMVNLDYSHLTADKVNTADMKHCKHGQLQTVVACVQKSVTRLVFDSQLQSCLRQSVTGIFTTVNYIAVNYSHLHDNQPPKFVWQSTTGIYTIVIFRHLYDSILILEMYSRHFDQRLFIIRCNMRIWTTTIEFIQGILGPSEKESMRKTLYMACHYQPINILGPNLCTSPSLTWVGKLYVGFPRKWNILAEKKFCQNEMAKRNDTT
jgi:hypothetical protein